MRKTRKIIQEDYEQQYMGSVFKIENRYAQLIAMFFIILMYSTAIPLLYFAGLLICASMYWSDKILFLRHYRLPPRYNRNLAERSNKIMKFAIILHLFTGVYMLSNRELLNYEEPDSYFGKPLSIFTGEILHKLTGLDKKRFRQPHTALYIIGTLFFTLVYIIDSASGFITKLMTQTCCNVLIGPQKEDAHSCDIYRELAPEDQQHEFKMTNRILKRIETHRTKNPSQDDIALLNYFEQRINQKLLNMRLHL